MIFENLVSFIIKARYWVVASMVAGLLAGLAAGFLFNPYIVSYSLKNISGYFSIENLKSTKIETAGLSEIYLSKMTDRKRASSLEKMLTKFEWLETNITPVYGITKSDMRDLVEPPTKKDLGLFSEVIYLNIRAIGEDIAWEKGNVKFVSDFILYIAYRNRFSNWLAQVKTEQQQMLTEVGLQLPNVSLLSSSNQGRIEALKNIITSNKDDVKNTPVYLTMNQGQGNNNEDGIAINNRDLTAFISPAHQLAGLQINQVNLETTLNQLHLKREVSEYLSKRAIEGQNLVARLELTNDNEIVDLFDKFWRQDSIAELIKKENGWRLDYVEGVVKALEIRQNQLRAAYLEMKNQGLLIGYKRKFSRSLAIIVGLFGGLVVPLILFALRQFSETEQQPSGKA